MVTLRPPEERDGGTEIVELRHKDNVMGKKKKRVRKRTKRKNRTKALKKEK